jgi:TonB family protein
MYSHSVPAPRSLSLGWLIIVAIIINLLLLSALFYLEINTDSPLIPAPDDYFPLEIALEEPPASAEEQAAEQETPSPPPIDEIAALKPRASVFGATHEVDDTAEFTPGTTDSLATTEDGSGFQQELPQATNQPASEHSQPTPVPQKITEAIDEQDIQGQDLQDKQAALSSIETVQNGIATQQTQIKQQQKKVEVLPDPTYTQLQKPAAPPLPQQRTAQQTRPTRNNTGSGKRTVSPIDRTKQLSFKDLAQGFLESLKNEGQDWMERKGNESIRPNASELRYHCYLQKVYWQLQSICKQAQIAGNPGWETNMRLGLEFIINRNGELTAVHVIEPTGHLDADELGISLIRKAAPFAPIPQHIQYDQIPLTFYIIFNSTQSRLFFSYS